MWYLKKGAVPTKDNVARRNVNGSKTVASCTHRFSNVLMQNFVETIQHLFFKCAYARFMWRAVHIVFGIAPPLSFENLFHQWLGGQNPNLYLLTGAVSFRWAIWLIRNEKLFF